MRKRLAGKDTCFLPFNQGSNGAASDGGAGNPPLDEKRLVQRVGSGPATKYAVRETSDEKITQLQIALDNLKTKE